MEESRIKELEAKLQQLFAQNDQINAIRNGAPPLKSAPVGAKVIRRRKGKPDLHIS